MTALTATGKPNGQLLMADKALIDRLKQGTAAWNAWRKDHAEASPDLSGGALRGLNLVGADLAGVNLSKADLRGAILSGANLAGANLEASNLFKAVLDGADLNGTILTDVQFLNCAQLTAAKNWQLAIRDESLACGAPIPR